MVVKTTVGEFDINTLTWKQVKQAGIISIVKKITAGNTENMFESVTDEDIDKVVRSVAGDKTDEMTFDDIINMFTAIVEKAFETKK